MTAIWGLVLVTTFAVPLAVFTGESSFRVVKESIFTAASLLIAALVATGMIWGRLSPTASALRRPVYAIPLAIVAWGGIATIMSTNRPLSVASLVWIASGSIFFAATAAVAKFRRIDAVLWASIAAVINAVVLALQAARIWNPIHFPSWVTEYDVSRIQKTALIGNPNDVGAYFIAPALAAMAFAIAVPTRRRIAGAAVAVICCAAIVLTETFTAIAALATGAIAMAILRWRGRAVLAVLAVVLATGVGVIAYEPLRSRAVSKTVAIANGDVNELLSHRLTPALAALEMWRSRPVFGVGPGCFGFHYHDAKIAVEERHATLLRGDPAMYYEAHNDHLQVLAQSGVPGYALMLVAVVSLGRLSLRRGGDVVGHHRAFARLLSLPLALSFAIAALAAFPLELAAPMTAFLFFAALCAAWSAT